MKDYDRLSATAAVKAVKGLTRVEDVRAVVRFEETHQDRHGVVSAGQVRIAELAKQAVGIS